MICDYLPCYELFREIKAMHHFLFHTPDHLTQDNSQDRTPELSAPDSGKSRDAKKGEVSEIEDHENTFPHQKCPSFILSRAAESGVA